MTEHWQYRDGAIESVCCGRFKELLDKGFFEVVATNWRDRDKDVEVVILVMKNLDPPELKGKYYSRGIGAAIKFCPACGFKIPRIRFGDMPLPEAKPEEETPPQTHEEATQVRDVLVQEIGNEIRQLRAWAKESVSGGWSTNYVDAMTLRANALEAVLEKLAGEQEKT